MNEYLEKFTKLPKSQKTGIIAGSYIGVLLLWYFLLFGSATDQLSKLQAQNQQLKTEKQQTQTIAADLDRFRREVEALDNELSNALKELPNEREIDKLLTNVATLGRKIGLEFTLFEPMKEVFQEFYAEVPVKIEVLGTYHEVGMFFDAIGKLSRIVNVQDVVMSKPFAKGGKMIVKTGGRATTYRFVDPVEAAAMAAKDPKNKKKGGKKKEEKKKEEKAGGAE